MAVLLALCCKSAHANFLLESIQQIFTHKQLVKGRKLFQCSVLLGVPARDEEVAAGGDEPTLLGRAVLRGEQRYESLHSRRNFPDSQKSWEKANAKS